MITSANLNSTQGMVEINLAAGNVILIAGPNGVGKSALLFSLFKTIPQNIASYYPGHRQINFNHGYDNLSQDMSQLRANLYSNYDAFNRFKSAWSEDQFKSIIRTIMNLDSAFNREFRTEAALGKIDDIEREAALCKSPIDTLNNIFSQAGLLIKFNITEIGLTANRAGSVYSVDALSDGERAALFIVGAFVTQPQGTVLLLDEPEKHLHPSITGVLMEASLRARPDIAIVISSHDLSLIERLHVSSTIYVKNSTIVTLKPELRIFDVEIIDEAVPDQLRADILGSRSKIIFIEGTDSSRDASLYSNVYLDYKISSKGASEKVIESVRGIRTAPQFHWLEVVGLIDGDGRNFDEVEKLRNQGVMTLGCPTIENLFFLPEMQDAFIGADINMIGGLSYAERKAAFNSAVTRACTNAADDIVARQTCWAAQRALMSNALSVKDVKSGNYDTISVSVLDIKKSVEESVELILKTIDRTQLIMKITIKNSDIPDQASKALGANSFKQYCDVILRQLEIGSAVGKRATAALREFMPKIPSENNYLRSPILHTGRREVGGLSH